MMRAVLLFLLLVCGGDTNAQVKRAFLHYGNSIEVLAQNNRTENNFSFPAMSAYIIISSSSQPLTQAYASDSLRQMPVSGMNDYACFYYINSANIPQDTAFKTFIKTFISWCYTTDYIDRNAVHLVWQSADTNKIPCSIFEGLDTFVSSVHLPANNAKNTCDVYIASSCAEIWQKSKNAKTSIWHHIPTFLEVEADAEQERKKAEIDGWRQKKGNVYLQLTAGYHQIEKNHQTAFDTATLVDFARLKTLWNIQTGYYVTRHIAVTAEIAFIYSGKKKQINSIDWGGNGGITVSGSGYAGAMLRYGIGLCWLVYNHKRTDVFLTCNTGKLAAIAGGGSGTKTIGGGSSNMDIVRQKRQTNYIAFLSALCYRLSNVVYFTGNIQYSIAGLEQPIGSVNAFTGWSVNLGLGLAISTKKQSNDKE